MSRRDDRPSFLREPWDLPFGLVLTRNRDTTLRDFAVLTVYVVGAIVALTALAEVFEPASFGRKVVLVLFVGVMFYLGGGFKLRRSD